MVSLGDSMVCNLETGSRVKVSGSLAERSYTAETVKKFG